MALCFTHLYQQVLDPLVNNMADELKKAAEGYDVDHFHGLYQARAAAGAKAEVADFFAMCVRFLINLSGPPAPPLPPLC